MVIGTSLGMPTSVQCEDSKACSLAAAAPLGLIHCRARHLQPCVWLKGNCGVTTSACLRCAFLVCVWCPAVDGDGDNDVVAVLSTSGDIVLFESVAPTIAGLRVQFARRYVPMP
jgi:hypothetical protein